jgi:hypothetical protein
MAKNKGVAKTGTMAKGKLRPHLWISGTDEYRHQMYTPWMRQRAQANYRGEEYLLTFDEYFAIWNGYWHDRGRGADDLCMTREDFTGPWSRDNCYLAVRKELLSELNKAKSGWKTLGSGY